MTSRKNIKIFDFNGVNVAKHWHVAGRGICHLRLPCLKMVLIWELETETEMCLEAPAFPDTLLKRHIFSTRNVSRLNVYQVSV